MVEVSVIQIRNSQSGVRTMWTFTLPKREITQISYKRLVNTLPKLPCHFTVIIHKMWCSLTTLTCGESDSISSFIMCMCVHTCVFMCVLQNYKACKYTKWCDLHRLMQMFDSLRDGTWGCCSLFVKTSLLVYCNGLYLSGLLHSNTYIWNLERC